MAVVVDHYYWAKDTYWVEDANTVDEAIKKIENSEKSTYITREEKSCQEYYVFLSETSEGIQVPIEK